MTTKLDAINTMLSCIGHAPLNSLEGTKNAFTTSAENILESETKQIQLNSWDFNTEEDYPLQPDVDGILKLPENVVRVKIPSKYKNQYIIRDNKVYDKFHHTFKIYHPLRVTIIFALSFEELPEVVRNYIQMSAAYKFTKRELGSQATVIYTQEDLQEAKAALEDFELNTGTYSLIPEMHIGIIRGGL